jgi:hypothetical protein
MCICTTSTKFKLLQYLVSSEGSSSSCTAAPQCPSVSLKLAAATTLLNILPLRTAPTAVGLSGLLVALGEPFAAAGTTVEPDGRGDAEGDLPRPAALCSPNSALVPACISVVSTACTQRSLFAAQRVKRVTRATALATATACSRVYVHGKGAMQPISIHKLDRKVELAAKMQPSTI